MEQEHQEEQQLEEEVLHQEVVVGEQPSELSINSNYNNNSYWQTVSVHTHTQKRESVCDGWQYVLM